MSEDLPEINSASAEMSSRPPEGLLGPELRWHQHQDQLQEDFMARLRGDQDHPPIPELTETYQQAEASWQKLDQPGEANRLAASLTLLMTPCILPLLSNNIPMEVSVDSPYLTLKFRG